MRLAATNVGRGDFISQAKLAPGKGDGGGKREDTGEYRKVCIAAREYSNY